jgi:enoyl-CoA hydratase/carnithine racemase
VTTLADYRDRFERIKLTRDEHGILEVILHTGGGPLVYDHGDGPSPQAELTEAFAAIAADAENRVILLTGTGDLYSGPAASLEHVPPGDLEVWESIRRNGVRMLMSLLEIDAPIVSCINGPALRHAEIALLADIVLAADDATIQDTAHFLNRTVPGDGMHVVLPLLLGLNRGRYHLLTGKAITALEALAFGLVAEVHPRVRLLERGRELARELAAQDQLVLRYTRLLFTAPLKKAMNEMLGYGLALETLAALHEAQRRSG